MKKELDLKGLLTKNPASVSTSEKPNYAHLETGMGRPLIDGRGPKKKIYRYINIAVEPARYKNAVRAHKARDMTMTDYVNMLIDQDLAKNADLYEAFGAWPEGKEFK